MADNKLNITISATDKATKVINQVNKSVSKAFRPYENAKRSLKSFSDALGRNDLVAKPLWALRTIGKGVTTFGNAFGIAENSVVGGSARVAAALGAIGGPIGGLLAGTVAVVGGTAAVSVAMANMGQNISRTAKNLNINTSELQEYRGAAKLAGLETQAMDSSLLSLGSTLQEAGAGRNPMVAESLARMGITIRRTKDGAVDTLQAMRDVADVVSHMRDQNMARKLTDMLGITELLPLLREGTGKLDDYREQVRKLGMLSEDQVRREEAQAQAWNKTKTAMDGAAISVGNLIAKFFDLNNLAASTSAMAERLQKTTGFWSTLGTMAGEAGKRIWNYSPQTFLLRKVFGEFGDDKPQAGGASGSWADAGGGKPNGAAPATIPPNARGPVMPPSAAPRGIRNNNPGNLRSWMGAGTDGGYAVFPTPQAGLTAAGKNLLAYQDKYGINTLSGIVNRWAPAGDGNNVPAYIANLSKQTGFAPDQPLNLHDQNTLAPLLSAITKQENGQNPYSPEVIANAVAAAIRETNGSSGERPIQITVQNVPAGMTIKPVRGLGQTTIGLAMAPGGAS